MPRSLRIGIVRQNGDPKVAKESVEEAAVSGFGILRRGQNQPFVAPPEATKLVLQARLTIALRVDELVVRSVLPKSVHALPKKETRR